jgi:hypothetical protein
MTSAENNPGKELPFSSGEELLFDVHYRWGIIMAKAGTAHYSITEKEWDSKPAYCTALSFRTSSFFDKLFKIRDTLYSYVNLNLEPVYHKKYLHEGNTNYTEDLLFLHYGKEKTEAKSIRYNSDESIKFEKDLTASTIAFDMLSIFIFARTLDYDKLAVGTTIPLASFVGRESVTMAVKYIGQVILEKDNTRKYKTRKIEVDVVDDAFSTSKKALEMWIGDDQNKYPLRIKAKLKIGAAEANLISFKENKYPFEALIETKSK